MRNALKLSRIFVVVASLLLCAQAQAQTLIYALSYRDTPASLHARFPNGALGATINEKLAMVRGYLKTEIYSVSINDGKRLLLFSDEGMNLEIVPAGATLGAGKAYASGVVREWRTAPNPGVYSEPTAIYEISLDRLKRFRKVFETQPSQTRALLNPPGTKAVFDASVNGEFVFFVYELPTGKLHRWDFTKLTKAHCPDCIPGSYGWLPEGDRLFFNLQLGAGDFDEAKNHDSPGAYFTTEDGADLGGIPLRVGQLQLTGYKRWAELAGGMPPILIGQMVSGDYLFRDFAVKNGPLPKPPIEPESFLVITGPDFKSKKQIPMRKSELDSFSISPSGKYVAYVEERQTPNDRTGRHLWSLDLESGVEKDLLFTPPPGLPTSPEPIESFTVLGWIDKD
jgi:hypothetical protein